MENSLLFVSIISMVTLLIIGSKIHKNGKYNIMVDHNIAIFFMTLDESFQQQIRHKYYAREKFKSNTFYFHKQDYNLILDEISKYYYYDKDIKNQAEAFKNLNMRRKNRYQYHPFVITEKIIYKGLSS